MLGDNPITSTLIYWGLIVFTVELVLMLLGAIAFFVWRKVQLRRWKKAAAEQTPTLDAVRRYHETAAAVLTRSEQDARRQAVVDTAMYALANVVLLLIAWHFSKKVAEQ